MKKFNEICSAEYMLDFTIWCYVFNEKKIEEIKKSMDPYYLEDDPTYIKCVGKRQALVNKMIDWRLNIYKLKEDVFDRTELVDKRELYDIDYEAYNREMRPK